MNWKSHLDLKDRHAFLSPSGYHWLRYDEDKLTDVYYKHIATQRGTELHELACQCIRLGIRLPNSKKNILNLYVNDGIGYRMTPEQPLYFSENCFGTADTISFHKDFLRIHDLKTGVSRVSMDQLKIYAALFCMEYMQDPYNIKMELRIYQAPEPMIEIPDPDQIDAIMKKIETFDKLIDSIKGEESWRI